MSTSISKHNCAGITFGKHMPDTGNCITFTIRTDPLNYREDLEITLFGLPTKKAHRLIEAIKEIEKMEAE